MAAGKYDFFIEQGSSFQTNFVYKDKNKNAVDLTNWCARLVWKTNDVSTNNIYSVNSGTGIVVKDTSGILIGSILQAPYLLSEVSVTDISLNTKVVTVSSNITIPANSNITFGGVTSKYDLSTGGTSGNINFSLTPNETSLLTFSKAKYDLDLESPTGQVIRLLYGTVSIHRRFSETTTEDVCP